MTKATDQYSLPGKRIGGAQYFILPIGLLFVLMARFDHVRDTGAKARANVRRRS